MVVTGGKGTVEEWCFDLVDISFAEFEFVRGHGSQKSLHLYSLTWASQILVWMSHFLGF